MIRTSLALAFVIFFIPVAALITFPWTLITGKANFLYRVAMTGVRSALCIAGVKVEAEGREKLDPARSYIFMSNHVSNLDPPIVVPVLPGRTSVLVKKELFRVPILGWAMRMASLVPVDRDNRDAAIASIEKAAEVMRSGLHMTIFPEGTRSLDGGLLPFKKGPFHLALDTGMPIVPVTVLDTLEMMPKGRIRIHPGTARVIFHDPIEPTQVKDRDQLVEAVRASIAAPLDKK
ncbi:MAG TPA: lysophospholipid acyltransferase family protein [Candidatus Angelobacter sp.]|nr:lysophospholipid acyltransferase family protein [Candidatus Angelobacter sp.]